MFARITFSVLYLFLLQIKFKQYLGTRVYRACRFLCLPPLSHVPNSVDPEHDKYYKYSYCENKNESERDDK